MSRFVYILFIAFFLPSCGTNDSPSKNLTNKKPSNSHLLMIQELEKLYQEGNGNKYFNWNKARADSLNIKIKETTGGLKVNYIIQYCSEMINAGEPKQAILSLENIGSSLGMAYDKINSTNKMYFDNLALAYLRLGEQINCQNNHNEYSCIAPIIKDGIHLDKNPSEKAIEIYSEILKRFPDDYGSQWLLNLAYMTVGGYPQDVPTNLYIDIKDPIIIDDVPIFKDIAMNTNSAINGLSGGVCLDDFNGDGLIDIFATSYWMNDPVKLLINNGHHGFDDKTSEAGLDGITGGLNCIHADYDNDGDLDVFILRGAWMREHGNHPNSLLRNNGTGHFEDVTFEVGINSYAPTQTAVWFDYDNDGDLDLYIGNEHISINIKPCEFYENQGNGKFVELAAQKGIDHKAFVKAVVTGDIDNDGWTDLFLSVASGPNVLYKNNQGQFKNIAVDMGVTEPIESFPAWFWDFDNDGMEDLFVCSYDGPRQNLASFDYAVEKLNKSPLEEKSKLFKNNGNLSFTDITKKAKLNKTLYGMGSNFGDINNDGYPDMYIGTGAPDLRTSHPNRMFLNQRGKSFAEVTTQSRTGHIQKGHGVAFADFDYDGDLDLYSVMGGALEGDIFTNVLFENPGNDNNWVGFHLEGIKSNRSAIGSKIIVTTELGKIYRTVNTGGSFGSSSLIQTIGLGKAQEIISIEIIWAGSQTKQLITKPESKKYFKILEGNPDILTFGKKLEHFGKKKAAHSHHHH